MRYSTLASAVLLAAATAPVLAHPITIRATEDAFMVERELQDTLMERGYYDDILSRDFEVRNDMEPKPPHPRVKKLKEEGWEHMQSERKGTPPISTGRYVYVPGSRGQPSGGSGHNGGARHQAGAHHRRREYDLDGELFVRATEDASIVRRELQDGLVERGYYDDLLSRGFEARSEKEESTEPKPPHPRVEKLKLKQNYPNDKKGTPPVSTERYQYFPAAKPHAQPQAGRSGNNGGKGGGAHHRRREYDLDGELFERSFEADELD